MTPSPYPIEQLLPHAAPMVLVDRVIAYGKESIETTVEIRAASPFFDARLQGVPSYVGLEYMAQSCGAFAGIHALSNGGQTRIGFLLGSRDYAAEIPVFPLGSVLTVRCTELYRDDQMGSFGCEIVLDAQVVVRANVNVFQPEDAAAFLQNAQLGAA